MNETFLTDLKSFLMTCTYGFLMARYLIEFRFQGAAKHELKKLIYAVDRRFQLRKTKRHRPVPHITLVGPLYTNNQKLLLQDFQELCSKQPLPLFNIKGFGTFSKSRVVYIKIDTDKVLNKFRRALVRRLRPYCKLNVFDRVLLKFHYHLQRILSL